MRNNIFFFDKFEAFLIGNIRARPTEACLSRQADYHKSDDVKPPWQIEALEQEAWHDIVSLRGVDAGNVTFILCQPMVNGEIRAPSDIQMREDSCLTPTWASLDSVWVHD